MVRRRLPLCCYPCCCSYLFCINPIWDEIVHWSYIERRYTYDIVMIVVVIYKLISTSIENLWCIDEHFTQNGLSQQSVRL